jgi:hypothetical protein
MASYLPDNPEDAAEVIRLLARLADTFIFAPPPPPDCERRDTD